MIKREGNRKDRKKKREALVLEILLVQGLTETDWDFGLILKPLDQPISIYHYGIAILPISPLPVQYDILRIFQPQLVARQHFLCPWWITLNTVLAPASTLCLRVLIRLCVCIASSLVLPHFKQTLHSNAIALSPLYWPLIGGPLRMAHRFILWTTIPGYNNSENWPGTTGQPCYTNPASVLEDNGKNQRSRFMD